MSIQAQIVVAGMDDRVLLSGLLRKARPDLVSKVGVMHAGAEALGVARSLLYKYRLPVALLLDADSPDEDANAQRRHQILAYLSRAPVAPFDVFLAVPEIEAVLFTAEGQAMLERVLDRPLSADELRDWQSHPRQSLVRLFDGEAHLHVAVKMSPEEAQSLAALEPFAGLIRFLDESIALVAANRAA